MNGERKESRRSITLSEKDVTEKEIDETLNKIMVSNPDHTIRFLARILFNLRFDLDDLKIELLKVLKDDEGEEINHKPEEEDGRFYT